METTINNLCNSCTNTGCVFQSGIVRTKCAFYIPPHAESDNCKNYVVMQQIIEIIPKADYEARLKTDLKAILVELQLQMEEYEPKWVENDEQAAASCRTWEDLDEIIQNKINALEEE